MKSLVIPITPLSILFLKTSLSIPALAAGIRGKEADPVENEELFDHLFVHDDRKFNRLGNQFFAGIHNANNF